MPRAAEPAPRTVVLLVRHALTRTTGTRLPGRAPGLHLSPAGVRQAEAVAARIARVPGITALYSSPLERAWETAQAIGRAAGLTAMIERDLVELDPGGWTGRSLWGLRRWPEWRAIRRYPSRFCFPGGESFTEMQARVTSALARLVERHPGGTIVAVSHGDPIKAAVAHARGTPLDLFQRIVITPASVTVIACGPDGPKVLATNSVNGDLAALLPR